MTDFYTATVSGTENLSACAWGVTTRLTKTAVDGIAVEFTDGSQGFSLLADSGQIFGSLTTSESSYETPRWTVQADDVGKEFAILCTYSGTELKLTVQGVSVGTASIVLESSIAVTDGDFTIGNTAGGGSPIDGMAVWGAVWATQEVDGSAALAWYNDCVDSSTLIDPIDGLTEGLWDGFSVRLRPNVWEATVGDLDLNKQGDGAARILFSQTAVWGSIPAGEDVDDWESFYGMEWD